MEEDILRAKVSPYYEYASPFDDINDQVRSTLVFKEAIPAGSWHQSIAYGIGIAILSDDQLLAKLR